MTGCDSEDLNKCRRHLEKFEIPGDKVTNIFGGGLQHHFRDFSHHCGIDGLFFSLLTQFTGKAYGTKNSGEFIVVDIPQQYTSLIGKTLPQKLFNGTIVWLLHLASDMAGCSSTALKGGLPTGVPGPILSLIKSLSSLLFTKINIKNFNEFSSILSKLFNGTLLGHRDENGKLVPLKFNLQSEIGIAKFIEKQAIPVIVNETIVRVFYFVSRFIDECHNKNITTINEFCRIDKKVITPFRNHTIDRMLTVSSLTFSIGDTTDAAVRSALTSGLDPIRFSIGFVSRFNYVGAGRAAFAVFKEFKYEVDTLNALCKKRELTEEQTKLVLEKIDKFKAQLEDLMCQYVIDDVNMFISGLNDIDAGLKMGDSNLVISGNIKIQNKLGTEQQFHNQEEFNELIESDDSFVL